MCAQITRKEVDALMRARRSLIPLVDAAELAGVDPIRAQIWLGYGRTHRLRLEQTRRNVPKWRVILDEFVKAWDSAAADYLTTIRETVLEHAKKDPKVAIQLMQTIERDYERSRRHRSDRLLITAEAERRMEAGLPATDLLEKFEPMDVSIYPAVNARHRTVTHGLPDGSTTTVTETTTTVEAPAESQVPVTYADGGDDFDSRSAEHLEFYAAHGYWPEHAPRTPQEPPAGAIDTEGESVQGADIEADPGAAAELSRGLQEAAYDGDELEQHQQASLPVEKQEVLPPRAPGASQRLPDPVAGLRKLERGEEAREVLPAEPPKVDVPPFTPLRRIDPRALDG